MTRSTKSSYSPKAIRKTEKAASKQAVKDGLADPLTIAIRHSPHYRRQVIHANLNRPEDTWKLHSFYDESPKKAQQTRAPRRNAGRMDGTQWNGGSFVCVQHVDSDFDEEYLEDDDEDEIVTQAVVAPAPSIEVSLLDLAKTLKPRN